MSGRNGKRGKRGGIPAGVSRNERKAEAGFTSYCKCPTGFKQWPPAVLATFGKGDTRRFRCRQCGHNKPEWRCPVHKLKSIPVVARTDNDTITLSAGCPRCGRAPKEQRFDAYMTAAAKTS